MRKMTFGLVALLVLLALVAGCAPQAAEPAAPQPAENLPTLEVPADPTTAPVEEEAMPGDETEVEMGELDSGEVPEAIFAAIVTDLASRTASTLRADDIVVVKAESVVWPDGSLGCPEPDMMYTMATVNGYHVVLETPEGTFDFRVSDNGNFRLCENAPFPPTTPIDSGTPTG